MPFKYYAGIGSRQTPNHILKAMTRLAKYLECHGFILRSGGADGADKAFETGVQDLNNKQIFLPWQNFNKNQSNYYNIPTKAFEISEKFHPRWNSLKFSVQKLMARNAQQVLGPDLKTPVEFIICWTSDGKDSGGTGQAIRIARSLNIPIYNLFNSNEIQLLKQSLKGFVNNSNSLL